MKKITAVCLILACSMMPAANVLAYSSIDEQIDLLVKNTGSTTG